MSVEALALVLHHSRATGTTKLVALGIANHDGDGGAYPTMRTLAKYGACSVRNARKAVARLVELGEVRVAIQQGGDRDCPEDLRPNRYYLLVKCPPECDRTKEHRMPKEARRKGGSRPTGEHPEKGGSVATGGSETPEGGEVPSDPQTVHSQPRDSGSASTTDRARTAPSFAGLCSVCFKPEDACRRLEHVSGHTYTPRARRTA